MSTGTNRSPSRSVTVGFSIPKTEQSRLDHLVEVFSGGNRSAFLRMAMERMEVEDRAHRLRSIQAYGTERCTDLGSSPDQISDRVKRVLARRAKV